MATTKTKKIDFKMGAAALCLAAAASGSWAGAGPLSLVPLRGEAVAKKELGFWARGELAASLSPLNPYEERFGAAPGALAQVLRERAVALGRSGALTPENWRAAGLSDPETLAVAGADEKDLKALAVESEALPPSKIPPLAVAAGLSVAGLALLSVSPHGSLAFLSENPWDKVVHFTAGAAIGFCSSEGGGVGGAATGLGAGVVVGVGKEMLDKHFDPRDAWATIAGSVAGVAARKISGSDASCDPSTWGLSGKDRAAALAPSPVSGDVARGWEQGKVPADFLEKPAGM